MAIIKTTWFDIIYDHNHYFCENNKKTINVVCRKPVQALNVVGQSTCGFPY
jgi:hypothetical protein